MLQTEMTLTPGSIEPFRQSLSVRGLGPLTVKAYSTDLRVFFLEMELELLRITELESTAASWLNKTRRVTPGSSLPVVAAKTTIRRLTSLRSFGTWAGVDILRNYSGPTPPRATPRVIPGGMDAVRQLIRETEDDELRALLGLCGLNGLRVGEARSLFPEYFDLTNRTFRFMGKGDVERIVPFTEEAFDAFAVQLAITPPGTHLITYQDRWARKLVTQAAERILEITLATHGLRKTFGTAVNDEFGLRTAQELLGHASIRTTETYTFVAFDTMRAALEGI